MAGWNEETAAGPLGAGTITLVEGSSFCISLPNGDIFPQHPHGLFHRDTRILSCWSLTINGRNAESLTAQTKEPFRGLFAGRIPRADGFADSPLIVERTRDVGAGLAEELTIRNYAVDEAECLISLHIEADFADLFEVKEARIQQYWQESRESGEGRLAISSTWRHIRKGILVLAPEGTAENDGFTFHVNVPPHGSWSTSLRVVPISDEADGALPIGEGKKDGPSPMDRRRLEWVAKIPKLHMGNPSIERTLRRSYDDLGALRIEDPKHPERVVVAAGAPWFMTLFGRDSLLASEMALPVDPSLALGTLQTLADYQGQVVDPVSEEEPGKILHEVRLDVSTGLALGGKSVYYGSVDATPLFVAVLGSVGRWGFAREIIDALLPHADRAMDWIRNYGDKDGDGFVEYERLNQQGLLNQGWKDSWDGINFADGRLAKPPLALCEVQAYVYAAYSARAWMAYDSGDEELGDQLADEMLLFKEKFNRRFWMPRRGYYAVALDSTKQQVDACASNMGQCLWFGLVDDDKAPMVAERLMSPEMFSGWGVRTLASDMGAYNPASYHNGSVWPHDNAIIAAGLLRYGFVEEAQRISTSLLEAAEHCGGRLPELFCGFSREQFPEPVPYPTACSPQAWAATTPILLITSLMRYDAHISHGGMWMDPVLPASFGDVHITNAPMGSGRITIDVKDSVPAVQGLPADIAFHRGYRPWISELVERADRRARRAERH